ncbi:MAG: hypothetical protein JNL88_05575 [Bacteroidia bacterium]|nr:hypothetical protein [Bacteroidia bacterium]
MRELEIHEVFTVLDKDSHVFAGVFDSRKYPFTPAAPVRCNYFSSLMILKGEGFLVLDHFE